MKKLWTKQEEEMLIADFANTRTQVLADRFGRSYSAVSGRAYMLKLNKSQEYLKSEYSGRQNVVSEKSIAARFKKGLIPHNKGRKWHEYVSEDTQKIMRKTTFKPGRAPHNTKTDMQITWRNDDGRKYQYIRLSKAKWIPLHVFNWEKVHGKVPKGMIVVFKTKSTENCDISNLELISRAENMNRNTFHRYPEEIKELMYVKAVLTRNINKKK